MSALVVLMRPASAENVRLAFSVVMPGMIGLLRLLGPRHRNLDRSVLVPSIGSAGWGIHGLCDIFWHALVLLAGSIRLFLVIQCILVTAIIAILLPLLRLVAVRRRFVQILDDVG